MSLNDQFRRNVRTFYAWLGSMILLGVSPLAALWLIEGGTLLSRVAAVVVGTVGPVAWLWAIALIVRRGDEFVRRMHLVAIAIAAAVGLVLLVMLNWLVQASFIEPPDFMFVWVGFLMLWVVALFLTKRHYERER